MTLKTQRDMTLPEVPAEEEQDDKERTQRWRKGHLSIVKDAHEDVYDDLEALDKASHTHNNKALLDTYTQTEANLADAVSKKHTQNTDTALGAQSQDLNMNTHKVVNVVDPTSAQDAATKNYVDNPGRIVQFVSYQTGEKATGTTIIPSDDTIPQNTEGNEYMTLAITPKNSNNILIIEVVWTGANGVAGAYRMTVALFKDSVANALAAMSHTAAGQSQVVSIGFKHIMVAGTTSTITFKVRAGGSAAGTTTFNGQGSAREYGGVLASSITITEMLP